MIKREVVSLKQHTHPASHKNSALRVGLLFIDMAKIAYPKQIKSFDDQISILKSRGMVIKDEARKTDFAEYQLLSSQWLLASTLG